MIFDRLLGARPVKAAARRLHDAAVAQARTPALYARMGAPDTIEGRFELLTLHVILLIERLREAGAAQLSQALFDVYVGDLDGALREMGVGDLSVGKKMRKLGEAFYGRAKAYDAAFDDDSGALDTVIARVILGDEAAPATMLADYVRSVREVLAEQETAAIVAGAVRWPAP
jgi:cytochrome b pre-mRNA-processing protein 3